VTCINDVKKNPNKKTVIFFHMAIGYLLTYALLISICLSGLLGLFLFQEYVKKISCLSVSYSSFLILVVLLSLKNNKQNEILIIMVSVLILFAINLLTGIAIAKNISAEGADKDDLENR
jgi:hypothetical protein